MSFFVNPLKYLADSVTTAVTYTADVARNGVAYARSFTVYNTPNAAASGAAAAAAAVTDSAASSRADNNAAAAGVATNALTNQPKNPPDELSPERLKAFIGGGGHPLEKVTEEVYILTLEKILPHIRAGKDTIPRLKYEFHNIITGKYLTIPRWQVEMIQEWNTKIYWQAVANIVQQRAPTTEGGKDAVFSKLEEDVSKGKLESNSYVDQIAKEVARELLRLQQESVENYRRAAKAKDSSAAAGGGGGSGAGGGAEAAASAAAASPVAAIAAAASAATPSTTAAPDGMAAAAKP